MTDTRIHVRGRVAPGFEAVRDKFAEYFANGDEKLGAGCAVYYKGREVVSLWGGSASSDGEREFTESTLCNGFSATKGLAALALAKLVDMGLLRYQDKVVKYWPEFGAHGKEDCTVAMLASHQAGLCACRDYEPSIKDFLVPGKIAKDLAAQEPFWKPGMGSGYHAQTLGFLIGELVIRVTGLTIGQFFQRHIAEPFGIDAFIGLPEHLEGRAAEMGFFQDENAAQPSHSGGGDGSSGSSMYFLENDLQKKCFEPSPFAVINSRKWRAAELASINGQISAKAMARMYGALATPSCSLEGKQVIAPAVREQLIHISRANDEDKVLGAHMRWAQGMMRNPAEFGSLGPNPNSFGHPGFGGQEAFADPDRQLAFSFVHNGLIIGLHLTRHLPLVEVVYECVDRLEKAPVQPQAHL